MLRLGVAFSGAVLSGSGTRASPRFIVTAATASGGCCALELHHMHPGRSLSSSSVVCLGQAKPSCLLPYLSGSLLHSVADLSFAFPAAQPPFVLSEVPAKRELVAEDRKKY